MAVHRVADATRKVDSGKCSKINRHSPMAEFMGRDRKAPRIVTTAILPQRGRPATCTGEKASPCPHIVPAATEKPRPHRMRLETICWTRRLAFGNLIPLSRLRARTRVKLFPMSADSFASCENGRRRTVGPSQAQFRSMMAVRPISAKTGRSLRHRINFIVACRHAA